MFSFLYCEITDYSIFLLFAPFGLSEHEANISYGTQNNCEKTLTFGVASLP